MSLSHPIFPVYLLPSKLEPLGRHSGPLPGPSCPRYPSIPGTPTSQAPPLPGPAHPGPFALVHSIPDSSHLLLHPCRPKPGSSKPSFSWQRPAIPPAGTETWRLTGDRAVVFKLCSPAPCSEPRWAMVMASPSCRPQAELPGCFSAGAAVFLCIILKRARWGGTWPGDHHSNAYPGGNDNKMPSKVPGS